MNPRGLRIFLVDKKGYKIVYLGFLGIYFQVNISFEQLGVRKLGVGGD